MKARVQSKLPTPWKTLIIQFPPPREGKGVKCPGNAQGGGGMLKLRFDRYISGCVVVVSPKGFIFIPFQILSPLPPILFVHSLSLWSLYALIASNENKNNKTNKKTNRQTKTKTKIRTITWMLHDQPLSLRLDACYAILSNDSCTLQMFILSLRENLTYLAFPCSATHLLRLLSMLRSLGLVLIWWHRLRSTFQLVCPDDDIGGDSVYWQDFPCLGTQFLFLHLYLWPLVRKHVRWNILWNSQWKDPAHQTLSSLWVKACAASNRKIFPAVENPNLEQRF